MKTYPTKKLGEVLKLQGGFAFKSSEYTKQGIPIIRIQNLQDDILDFKNPVYLQKNKEINYKNFLLKKGDILVAMSGATTGKMARVKKEDLPALLNQRVGRFVIKNNEIDQEYLYLFLKTLQEKILTDAYGGAQPNISPKDIENIPIPLPPVEIQKKIVERIEKLMAKIDTAKKLRKEATADASALIPSALNKIFEEGKKKGWEEKAIGELCIINPRADIKNLKNDTGVSFIPMKAVDEKDGIITAYDTRKLSEVRKGYTYFANNDVLFAKITPCMENGKSAIAKNLKNGIGFGSTEFHVLRTKGGIMSELIHYHLRQKSFRNEAKNKMTGSAGQKRVPKDFLEKAKIIVPPLPEQKKIVKYLDSLSEKVRKIQSLQSASEKELKLLEKGILREAFYAKM